MSLFLCMVLESVLVSFFYKWLTSFPSRCSTSLIIRELQIKIPMGYHLTLVRTTAIKKFTDIKCWRGCGERGTLMHWWECKLVQPLWRTVWRFLKKLAIELPYYPAIPLLGTHIKETRIERVTHTPMFVAALFTIARTSKQSRCPLADNGHCPMNKEVVVHRHNGILLIYKKERIWVSADEMDETGAYYIEWSKSERETPIQYINSYIYGI